METIKFSGRRQLNNFHAWIMFIGFKFWKMPWRSSKWLKSRTINRMKRALDWHEKERAYRSVLRFLRVLIGCGGLQKASPGNGVGKMLAAALIEDKVARCDNSSWAPSLGREAWLHLSCTLLHQMRMCSCPSAYSLVLSSENSNPLHRTWARAAQEPSIE